MSSFLPESSAWSLLDSAPHSNTALMKANGVVYTPEFLADFVAAKALSLHFSKYARNSVGAPLQVLDPACGNGELLLAISRQHRQTPSKPDALPHLSLFGAELEDTSARATRSRLEEAGHEDCQIECTNALLPFNMDRNSGWRTLGKQWGVTDGFDIIIANPPWGADVSDYSHRLMNGGYSLNKGQFDTSDLFVELSLSLVKRGGFIAFIIPDSLFSDERKNLRRLLLHTNIKFVGRLGEKIFKGINRGCAVVICEVTDEIDAKNDVTCLRLTPDSRRALLDKQTTLNEIEERDSHQVPQQRFLDNRQYRFDIDNRAGHDIKLQNAGVTFGTYLQSTRGVELSKTGKVCQCPSCNKWIPHPRSKNVSCSHCGSMIEASRTKALAIINKDACEDVLPIIVGENIQRYTLCGNLWLTLGIEGINYKSSEIYNGPKLLVRKTGVGISATIDYSNSFTNQVVYIFKLKTSPTVLPLEFFWVF